MVTDIYGNNIRIVISPNELTNNRVIVTLPDGYSYETIHITFIKNIGEIAPFFSAQNGLYNFPPVRSHSPSTFNLYVQDLSQRTEIRLAIEKFGQIPDPNYFDNHFDPILVVGDDGHEYNVIPSDQFK